MAALRRILIRIYAAVLLAVACSFAASARDAFAADYTWSGTTALWSTSNWVWTGGTSTFPAGNSGTNTAIINSGTVSFGVNDTFGNADTTSSPVIRIGSGATLASGGFFTTIYNLEMNGGTLLSNGGINSSVGTFQLGGTLSVGGNSASTISTGAGSNNVINVGAAANSVLTLNVADVTNSSAADLTIGTVLQNYYAAGGVKVGNLTKAGAGTAVLTAANTYTGTTSVNGGTLVLAGANSLGAMNVNGGVLSVTGTTTSGANTTTVASSGTAQMNVSGRYTTQNITLGRGSGAVGAMVQTSGTTSVTQTAGLYNLQIGAAAGAFGYYGMTGGSLAVNELGLGGVDGGAGTIGILDVSGGTFDVNGWLTTNRSGNATSTSVLNLSGNGTVITRGGNGLQSFGGTNVYNLSGSSTLRVSVATASALGTGDFNLAGGTLETNAGVTSAGRINLNGGTIKALASSTLIGTTTGGVTVYGGGVTIDTNGYDSTITPALVAASGTGVSAVAVTNAGSGYIAAPLVTLTGGGGTGATGFATIANGTISGITIVNPGSGYTSAPTVSLSGGGGSGATFGTVSMAANTAAGGLTKKGSGKLTLSASNTYTGATTVEAGVLALSAANRLADTGAVTVNAGGFDLGGFSDTVGAVTLVSGSIANGTLTGSSYTLQAGTVSAVLAGGGPLTKSGAGIAYLTNNNTYSGTTTIASGTLGIGNGGTAGSLGTGPVVNNGSLVFDRYTNNWTVASPISGSGSVTKRGGATMTLSGSNTFTGDFTQWGGVTILSNTTGPALYADGSPGRIVISNELGGATYFYNAVVMGAANQLGSNVDVSIQPRNISSGYSYFVLQGNNTTIGNLSSTQAFASSWAVVENQETGSYGNSRLTVTQTVDGTFTGEFRNGYGTSVGTLGLTKNGAATLTLVDAGGNGIGYTGSTIVNAGKLVVSSTNFTSAVSTAAGATFEIANAASQTLNSTVVVSGSGVFAKSGAGTLTLSGTNTNTGGLVVNGGALQFTTDAQLGGVGGGITLNGGQLYNNNSAPTIAAGRTITLGTAGGYFATGWSQTTTVAGRVTGQGGLGIAFDQGTLMLSGSNDYAGATTIGTTASPWYWANNSANPTLKLGNANALPTGTPLVFGTSANNNTSTLDLNGYSASVGGMAAGTNATIDNTAAGTATLTMSPSSGTSTFAGVIKNTSGAVSVVKTAAGTQVLAGANTYTGTTTISGGTLQVGNGGTTGALGSGAVVNNAQLAFNRSNALTVSAAISGSGGVSQIGTGTTTFTGGNTFTGNYSHAAGVTVLNRTGGPALFASGSAGTLAISNSVGGANNWYSAVVMGSTNQLGSNVNVAFAPQNIANGLAYFVLQGNDTTIGNLSTTQAYASSYAIVENQETGSYGNSRLTVTQTVDGTFTGEFRNGYGTSVGTLGLTKNGAATLTLTPAGGNGINYTGSTIVNAGRLVLKEATGFASGVAVASGATLEVNNGSAQSLGVAISGSGSFVKSGAGTLAFTSVKTYTGDTTVNSGTLNLAATGTSGGASSIASTNIVVNAGATLLMSGTGYNTALGWGNNATFVLNGGTLDIANNGYSYVKNLVMNNGAAFTLGTGFVPVTVNGANFDLASVVTSASSTAASTISSRGGLNQIGNVVFDVARGNFVGTTDLTVSSTMAGSGSLTKNGSGVLTLTAANTYTGGSVVNAGTLVIGTGGGLANNASNTLTVNNGGTVTVAATNFLGNHTATIATPIVVNAGGVLQNSGAVFNTLGALTLNGGTLQANGVDVTSGQSFALKGTVTVDGSTTSTIAGNGIALGAAAVAGTTFQVNDGAAATDLLVTAVLRDGAGNSWPTSQASSLTKAGAGRMVLAGANTYTGTTTISAGTLQVGNGGTAGSLGSGAVVNNAALVFNRSNALAVANVISGSGSVTQAGLGTTTLTAANSYTGTTIVDAGVLATSAADRLAAASSLTVNAAGTFRLGGNQALASIAGGGAIALGNATLTTGSQSSTFAGTISGNGGLTKVGPGTLTLTGSNAFTGDTNLNGGTLVLASTGALPTDAIVTMQSGATLQLSGTTVVGAIENNGGTVSGGTLVASLVATQSGALNSVIADGEANGTPFAAGILKRGAGTTTVGAVNTFTGSVKVQGGMLQLTGSGAFDPASRLVMSSGATMDLNGKSQTFSALSGTGGTVALGSGQLTVNNAAGGVFAGVISGSGGVVKTGAGLLELTGASTYTGSTAINAGELKLNGALASSSLALAAGATLSGTGSIAGNAVIAGIHSPGNSPGVQSVGGDLTYSAGSSVTWELTDNTAALAGRGVEFDGINVGGNLEFSGTSLLNLAFNGSGSLVNWNDDFWSTDKAGTSGWLVYDVTGSTTGLLGLAINGTDWLDGAGNSLLGIRPNASFALQQVGSDVYLTFAAVPEPSSWVLAACGAVLATLTQSRRYTRFRRPK